ncbi:MAG TPA: lysophospholipase [Candidatus Limnocylindrales bacterium]
MSTSTTETVEASDGTSILTRRWAADEPPWAHIVLVHGVAEHSGRYEHVGTWLAADGLDVTAYDQRGFGGSGGRRAYVDRWSQHLDDLEAQLASVRAGAAGRPVALYGHSLGGLLALGYAVADPPRPPPDALILSAPAVDATVPAWTRQVARILGRIAPTVSIGNDFDGEVLSRDPSVGERYLADPLAHHRTTTGFAAAALDEQRRVRGALHRLSVPTLVVHGEDDRLVPSAASEPLAAVPGVTRRTHPGLRHEMHNEPEAEEVIAGIVAWLRSVLQSEHN